MKRAILLLVVLVGGAFYLGWFTFTTDSTGQTEHVNIVINKDKVQQDEGRALQKLHSLEQQAEEQGRTSAQGLPGADRSADRRMQTLPQPIAPYEPQQPGNVSNETRYQPAAGTEYAPAEPAPQSVDPYETPQRPRSAGRPVTEGANENFSRGFQ